MTKEIVIEDLRGRGMTAKVTDVLAQFSTYKDFAERAGYPDAVGGIRGRSLRARKHYTFKVLARGNHDYDMYSGTTIYVIESEDDERFLVGDYGLEITESMTKLTPKQLHEMDYDELIKAHKLAEENADELSRALRRKAYANGYEQGRFDQRMETAYEDVAKIVRGSADEYVEKTQQERRDEIVEQAKADIEGLKDERFGRYVVHKGASNDINGRWRGYAKLGTCVVEFVVNKDKQTVVALLKGENTGRVYAKGIAKCDPSDCFNVHIGKAIALHRALGLVVPVEYLDAPQPTEVRVGDVVDCPGDYFIKPYKVDLIKDGGTNDAEIYEADGTWLYESEVKIIDDSREE